MQPFYENKNKTKSQLIAEIGDIGGVGGWEGESSECFPPCGFDRGIKKGRRDRENFRGNDQIGNCPFFFWKGVN